MMRRGRPKKSAVDRFQAIAWFNAVSYWTRDSSPYRLEKRFQPENIKMDHDGKQVGTRAWDKYRKGERLPKDGYRKDGRPGPVVAAGKVVPDSLYVYRHPLWGILRSKKMSFDNAVKSLGFFVPSVRHFYLDLESSDPERQFESFAESVGMPIWIDREDDFDRSLDHLAINLMILRLDNFRHNRAYFEGIAQNIAKTLGPLSVSPWFGEIYAEFYDWLEINVWGDIFNQYYTLGSSSTFGWRRSCHEWL